MHIGHGLFGDQLRSSCAAHDVQLNLHNNPYPSFENRVCIALAAGHLLISEPLSPAHELRPGRDFLEARIAGELLALAEQLWRATPRRSPTCSRPAGARPSASARRAIYPALLRDAVADVAAHGSARRLRAAA